MLCLMHARRTRVSPPGSKIMYAAKLHHRTSLSRAIWSSHGVQHNRRTPTAGTLQALNQRCNSSSSKYGHHLRSTPPYFIYSHLSCNSKLFDSILHLKYEVNSSMKVYFGRCIFFFLVICCYKSNLQLLTVQLLCQKLYFISPFCCYYNVLKYTTKQGYIYILILFFCLPFLSQIDIYLFFCFDFFVIIAKKKNSDISQIL